nr:E3 ubiquitin-protein ligase HERC2-like [Pongo abelii]
MGWVKHAGLHPRPGADPEWRTPELGRARLPSKVWRGSPEWDPERRCLLPSPSRVGLGDQGCSRNARHQRARSIRLQDQHLALAILLELAVQRGTLSLPMLSAILLLLQLWDSGAQEMENERSTAQGTSAPLLPLLQRFQSIICRKDTPHSEGDMQLLSGPLSPIESFLRYLPQDNELAIDLRQMVVVVMAHLDRLATPCRCLHCVALRRLIRGAGLWFLNVFAVEIVIWVESE